MPIYAYRCAACGHTKDVLRKMSDPPLADCPACGAPRFEKQVTAAGFQLKGSGWYVTDFRNPQSAPAAAKDEPAKPATDKADGTAGAKVRLRHPRPQRLPRLPPHRPRPQHRPVHPRRRALRPRPAPPAMAAEGGHPP